MSTTDKARNTAEGGGVNLETYDWASIGSSPLSPTESVYEPLKEPAAELDNDWNYKTREDLKRLNHKTGSLDSRLTALEGRVTDLEGRVTALETDISGHTHDGRYYTKTQADGRFFLKAGDTATGTVFMNHRNTTATRGAGPPAFQVGDPGTGLHSPSTGVLDIYGNGVLLGRANQTGNTVDMVNADLFERGNRVATRAWANSQYLARSGGTMTNTITFQNVTTPWLVYAGDADTDLLRVERDTTSEWGFRFSYRGSATGNSNSLDLWADNGTGPPNEVLAWRVYQNGNIDYNQNEAIGFRLENRANRPTSPKPGRLIYRTDRDK